ncbi:hypothetical protein D9757_012510 [Collybiopsis confluens]|uniref:Uncharacterized protein n=1 Tax=Collybiopsis confluens TaxID=2823264 RepID=A0A8H5FXD7_9AGAR|nr:hypothetical protein D9757_012510 [Collybiopsis confluens]
MSTPYLLTGSTVSSTRNDTHWRGPPNDASSDSFARVKPNFDLLKVKWPETAFMLFRRNYHEAIPQAVINDENLILSRWKSLPIDSEERMFWEELAEVKEEMRAQMVPSHVSQRRCALIQFGCLKDRTEIPRIAENISRSIAQIPSSTTSSHSVTPCDTTDCMQTVPALLQHDQIEVTGVAPSPGMKKKARGVPILLGRRPSISDSAEVEQVPSSQENRPDASNKNSSPASLFSGSENFSISDGNFHAVGRDMRTSNAYHDDSTTTLIFNHCTFSSSDPEHLKDEPIASAEPEPLSFPSLHPRSSCSSNSSSRSSPEYLPNSHLPRRPPPSPEHARQSKRRYRWSTTTFIPIVYHHYIQPIMIYPVRWIASCAPSVVLSWFAFPPPPHSCMPGWWPGWSHPNYNW